MWLRARESSQEDRFLHNRQRRTKQKMTLTTLRILAIHVIHTRQQFVIAVPAVRPRRVLMLLLAVTFRPNNHHVCRFGMLTCARVHRVHLTRHDGADDAAAVVRCRNERVRQGGNRGCLPFRDRGDRQVRPQAGACSRRSPDATGPHSQASSPVLSPSCSRRCVALPPPYRPSRRQRTAD